MLSNTLNSPPDYYQSGLTPSQVIFISSQNVQCIEPNLFANSKLLSGIRFNYNNFIQLPVGLFYGLTNLKSLTIFYTPLSSINENSFVTLDALTLLNLSNNKIRKVPNRLFNKLYKLEILLLNNNTISVWDVTMFRGLTSLKTLKIGNNIATGPTQVSIQAQCGCTLTTFA
jgi:leucine-rich repeats and immunoglobulin-like domains protein 1/3